VFIARPTKLDTGSKAKTSAKKNTIAFSSAPRHILTQPMRYIFSSLLTAVTAHTANTQASFISEYRKTKATAGKL